MSAPSRREWTETAFLIVRLATVCSHFLPKLSSSLSVPPSLSPSPLPPSCSFGLCWGCLFSLSLCHHSSGMSAAEWSSVLLSRSVNPLFRCTEQNLKNMPCFYILSGVPEYVSSQCLHHPALLFVCSSQTYSNH